MSERLDIGSVVDGRYRVVSRLGSGGMADVYCAEDLQLGRRVALKVLYRRFAEDQEFVERFRREASSAAGLQHQHVVSVYDRGEYDGTYWIAMEYLEGRSLKRLIQEEGPLAPERAVDLGIQILRAARFAHRRGIIHRDLKPHNVIVDDEGRAKVTDFGIARAGASDMTQTGSIMGTAQYLSPEQAQGYAVSAQSDIYSIGIILYEMLTGRVPFEGESAVTIALKQVSEAPVPPSQLNPAVSPGLEAAVMRALAKDPAQRYPDADAFIAALQGEDVPATEMTAVAAAPPPPPARVIEPLPPARPGVGGPPFPEEEERSRWWWWLLAILAVAALIVGGLLLLNNSKQVAVPDVVGASQAAAEQALRNKGFDTDATFETSTRPQGQVIGQDPSGGTQADKGSTVHLTVSGGPGQATVPSVAGMGRNAAAKKLTKAGFKVTEEEQFDDTTAKDHVIETRPPEGTPLDKGSSVTLVVSKGPEQVAVPSEVGKTLDDARNDLGNAGFKVSVTRQESSTADPDTVLSQDPAAGTNADKGSTVNLTVAKEPTTAQVPNEVGKQDTDAVSALQDAGFKVSISRQDTQNLDEDGIVLTQDPDHGSAKKGSTVKIVVGRFNPNLQGDGTPTTPTTPTTP
ncbi:MAG: Stk1 family PASTA domain-containing Ser/Thr kinase [Actinobacteria bacterium]|nr:MAG: Stk1 family PASTA domain-containing Ser/Thr kinase [Actinomycetota bacterium]